MRVNLITLVGAALIVVGIVAFAYRGIPYTTRALAIDGGSVQAGMNPRKTMPMSPLSIGLVLAGGAALIAVGSTKSS